MLFSKAIGAVLALASVVASVRFPPFGLVASDKLTFWQQQVIVTVTNTVTIVTVTGNRHVPCYNFQTILQPQQWVSFSVPVLH
jgi:hypothetical protein